MNLLTPLLAVGPPGRDHPQPQRLAAENDLVLLAQLLGRQGRAEIPVALANDRQRLGANRLRLTPIAGATASFRDQACPLIAFVNRRDFVFRRGHLPVPWSSLRSRLARRRLTSGNETDPKSHTGLPPAASQTTTRPRLRYRPARTLAPRCGTLKLSSFGGGLRPRLEHAVVSPQP
jgi:hypothetical protein